MNLGESAIVLRQRTVSEVFDLACRYVCAAARGLYLRLAAVVLLPLYAGCLALRYALDWEWPWVWIVAFALAASAQGVFTVAAGRRLFSETVTAREVLRAYGGRMGSHLFALVAVAIVIGAASTLFLIPAFIAWMRLLFVREASLLEGAGATAALRRSSRFTTSRTSGALQILLSLLAAHAGIVAAAELLGNGLVDGVLQLGKPFGSLWSDGGSPFALLGLFAGVPYAATARFLQYIDDRTRADGWDIQARFTAIAAENAAERRAA